MQMPAAAGLLLAGLLVVCGQQYARAYNYEDLIYEELYKKLAELEDRHYLTEAEGPYGALPPLADWSDEKLEDGDEENDDGRDNNIVLDSRDSGQADLRDHEYQEHSATKSGFQYISGGAGEGRQHLTPAGTQNNTQEVKSDESLPFYCHPPNPCPKGQTDADGCRSDIKDSAEFQKRWIDGLMQRRMCTCDEEHMYSCPKDTDTINTQKGHAARDKLDDVLDILLGAEEESDNPYRMGNKHDGLVAKKSPGMFKVDAQGSNPYLNGERLSRVAKKG